MQLYKCLLEYLQASLIGVGGVVMLQEVVIQQLQQLCRWQQARELGTQQGGGQQGVHSGWSGCKWEALRLEQGQAGSWQELVQDGWRGGQAHDDSDGEATMALQNQVPMPLYAGHNHSSLQWMQAMGQSYNMCWRVRAQEGKGTVTMQAALEFHVREMAGLLKVRSWGSRLEAVVLWGVDKRIASL